jgi:hypothetical protein
VSSTLRGGQPAARLDPRDAALVALAATGELKVVLPRALRRTHKRRITELGEIAQPVLQALKKAITNARAAAASAS